MIYIHKILILNLFNELARKLILPGRDFQFINYTNAFLLLTKLHYSHFNNDKYGEKHFMNYYIGVL